MTGANKAAGFAATLLLLFTLSAAPAKAQFGGGGGDMMTQMAPMLEMMKAKLGKRRFARVMQTVGPMMGGMMENGGGSIGGVEGSGGMMATGGYGGGFRSSFASMVSSRHGAEMMTMMPHLVRVGRRVIGHRHHWRRHRHHW